MKEFEKWFKKAESILLIPIGDHLTLENAKHAYENALATKDFILAHFVEQ